MTVTPPLACPHCRAPLRPYGTQFRCDTGHHFDTARGGHLYLATTPVTTGDTPQMLHQRDVMLSHGVFAPLHTALVAHTTPVLQAAANPVVVEVGAGTGDLLAQILDAAPGAIGVAIDASRYAARRAQRAHDAIQAVVADAWQPLPLLPKRAQVLLSVFSPRNVAAFADAIADDGVVLIATAGPRHLIELRRRFALLDVEPAKASRLRERFATDFVLADEQQLTWQFSCDDALAYAMIAMGPNAHHRQFTGDAISFAGEVTADVTVYRFYPKSDS